jgi:energy-coupling factor transporter ATP-binding protein EcfA2
MTETLEQAEMEHRDVANLGAKLERYGIEPHASAAMPEFTASRGTAVPTLQNRETGLPFNFMVDLTLKTLLHGGRLRLWAMSEQLKLPVAVVEPLLEFLRSERLCEVAHPHPDRPAADISFRLTTMGQQRAEAALQKSQYVGPAPVSVEAYVAQVERETAAQTPVSAPALDAAFAGLVVRRQIRDDLGTALNSGRPILIYGPSGSGKTFIAEHLVRALSGYIHVPYAILVEDEVIRVFDPLVHHAAPSADDGSKENSGTDRRWVLCKRPVVMCGGELTLATLGLQFDPHSRFYVAPPQVKANNGLLIIDDLGRQQVSPQDLMNRWIVPLDRRIDHFVLHTGKQFSLPFHLSVIFSSNLRPAELADEAFLRRLGYKIHIDAVDADEYRMIFMQACQRAGVPYASAPFDYLLLELHAREGRPLLACTPFDLVSMVRDRAAYNNSPMQLSNDALDWAWQTYFAADQGLSLLP